MGIENSTAQNSKSEFKINTPVTLIRGHNENYCSLAFKSGSCRNSSTLHLGAVLTKYHDKKVLLVDFDAQANLSMGLGFRADQEVGIVPAVQEKGETLFIERAEKALSTNLQAKRDFHFH